MQSITRGFSPLVHAKRPKRRAIRWRAIPRAWRLERQRERPWDGEPVAPAANGHVTADSAEADYRSREHADAEHHRGRRGWHRAFAHGHLALFHRQWDGVMNGEQAYGDQEDGQAAHDRSVAILAETKPIAGEAASGRPLVASSRC